MKKMLVLDWVLLWDAAK